VLAGHNLGRLKSTYQRSPGKRAGPTAARIYKASGDGYSQFQPKPSWQTGNANANRGVPDVALSAAGHDGYVVCTDVSSCQQGSFSAVEGTSAAAPSFAGIALLIQNMGPVGSLNPTLYALEARTDLDRFSTM
jgi:subtilase family serine protease